MDAILAENVNKKYKNGTQALSGLSLSVQSGEIFSLLGPNGAGKSTLIRILTTYLRPDSGDITMLGKDLKSSGREIRAQIACAAQQPSIDSHMSLEENMLFQARLYGVPKADAAGRMERLTAEFGLAPYRKKPVSAFSGGVKRRLDIALSLISGPKLLFLDEPTAGMDPPSRAAMWDMLKKIRADLGTTIFLTTHYLEEADHLSDHICIMDKGKELVSGTAASLRSLLRQDTVSVRFPSPAGAAACLPLLKARLPERHVAQCGASISVRTETPQADLEMMAAFLSGSRIPFHGIELVQPGLEDIFFMLTKPKGGISI